MIPALVLTAYSCLSYLCVLAVVSKPPTKHDCLEHLYLVVPVMGIYKCSEDGSEFTYDYANKSYTRLNGKRHK